MAISWKWKNYTLKTRLLEVDDGVPIYEFKLLKNSDVLFEGDTFRPSLSGRKMTDTLPEVATKELLSFLTVTEADMGADFFTDYSPEQLKFMRSQDCGDILRMVSEEGAYA